MRKVTIEKIESATVVTIEKDGKIQKKATSKSRDVRPVHGGVKIMPEKNETQFNNMIIKLKELTDDFGATTSNELIEIFAAKGFFFETQLDSKNNQEGCFHLVDNTLSMCNVFTVSNENFTLSKGGRAVLFFEVPDFSFVNIRATFNIGATKLADPSSLRASVIHPLTIHLNTSIYSVSEWTYITRSDKTVNSSVVSLSNINSDYENYPGNYLLKLKGDDGLNNPELLLQQVENSYTNDDEPLKVKGVVLNNGKKGMFIHLPKHLFIGLPDSFFVNLSSLNVTFQDTTNVEFYKNFPKVSIYDHIDLPEHESIEISDIVNSEDSNSNSF